MMRRILIALALLMPFWLVAPVYAGDTDPLFVNATSDNAHRARMALTFSKNQLDRKHPVTIFLNDRGVLIASKKNAQRFKAQQDMITGLIKGGATVLICPMCMEHYGVKPADVMEGVKVSNPELVGAGLFRDNTKTLTW